MPERMAILHRLADLLEAARRRSVRDQRARQRHAGQRDATPGAYTAAWTRYYAGWIDKLDGEVVPVVRGDALDVRGARALRRGRRDRPVERPDDGHGPEGGARAGRRQHGGGEAARDRAVRRAALRRARARGRPAARGAERRASAVPRRATRSCATPASTRCRSPAACATARQVMAAAAETLTPLTLRARRQVAPTSCSPTPTSTSRTSMAGDARRGAAQRPGLRAADPPLRARRRLRRGRRTASSPRSRRRASAIRSTRRVLMGPVVTRAACDAHPRRDRRARSTRARARCSPAGSASAATLADGYFVAPTVFGDVDHDSYLARDEIFGPVLSVLRFPDEDEVVAKANDSDFGLPPTCTRATSARAPAGPSRSTSAR